MTDVTNGSARPSRIDRSLTRLDRRVEAAALRPWRYPSGRDALTAAVSYSIPEAAKNAISLSGDDTEGVWRSYEKIPEVWAPLNYLARAIQQIELIVATHQPGESAPVPLEEVDKTLASAASQELDRLRSATGGFERILFSAAIQFLVPGKGFFVADQDEDGEDVLLVCSTSEVRRKPGGTDDQFERQVDAKRWKTVEGWVTGIRRPHARYSWKAHSSLYALQGACDEVLLLDRMYRSNARSRIGRGVLMAPREAEFRPLRPNRTNPEQDTLAFTLMKILTAAVTEEDSALNVAPAVLELKGDFIEKFRHVTFGEALDDKVAARYDRQLDRIAAGIDLPAALAKGLEDTNHWSAWAITDDAFDQYAAPICELICSSLTTAFLWPALKTSDALGEGAARPVIWYDPFRLRAKPPEGEEIDKAFDRGALSWAGYRNLRSIDEDDAPDDEELDRRAELGLLKGAGGGGQPPPTAVTQSPVQSRTAAEPAPTAVGPTEAPAEASLQAAAPPRRRPRAAGVGAQLFVLDQVLLEQLVRQASQLTRPIITAGLADDWKIELGDRFHQLVRPVQATAARVATRLGSDSPWLAAAQQDALEAASEEFIEGIGQWVGSTSTTIESAFPVGLARAALALAGGFRSSTEQPEPTGGVATGSNMLQALRESGLQLATWVWRYDSPDRPFPGHEALDGVEFASWDDPALEIQPADAWLEGTHYRPGDHDGCRCGREPLFSDAGLGSDDDESDGVEIAADASPFDPVAADFDEDAHPRGPDGKFGQGDSSSSGTGEITNVIGGGELPTRFSDSVLQQPFYHGTTTTAAESISREGFDESHLGTNTGNRGLAGEGSYFSEDPWYASVYASGSDNGTVLESRVDVRDPWEATMGRLTDGDTPYTFVQDNQISSADAPRAIREEAERRGHDAILIRGKDGSSIQELVVFNNGQIALTDRLSKDQAIDRGQSVAASLTAAGIPEPDEFAPLGVLLGFVSEEDARRLAKEYAHLRNDPLA